MEQPGSDPEELELQETLNTTLSHVGAFLGSGGGLAACGHAALRGKALLSRACQLPSLLRSVFHTVSAICSS